MARLEVQIDGNASGLERSLSKGSNSLNKFSSEASKVASKTDGLTKSVGSANGVALEFNRIIQDAPYGMMGIGNNITQLTDSFARLKQQTGSTGTALRQTISSMLSSGNMLSLGISAVVTAWTLWERYAQKANKATKDLEDGTKSYIEMLEGVQRASADGQAEATKDLTKLKLLYDATQNLTIPMNKRKEAAEELIKQYPKQFEGMTTEALLAGKASEAYDKLTASITATAMAAAYANKMTENAAKQLNNYLQIMDLQKQANDLNARIRARQDMAGQGMAAMGGGIGASSNANMDVALSLASDHADLMKRINELGKENFDITNENALLQKNYNDQIIAGADASGKLVTKLEKAKTTSKETKDVMDDLVKGSLSEYDRKIFEINTKYEKIFEQIQKIGDAGRKEDAFGLATQNKQFEVLQAQVNQYIDSMKKVKVSPLTTTTGVMNSNSLPGYESANKRFNKTKKADLDFWKETVEDMEKSLGRALSHFGRDFTKTLSSINQQADITFGSIFSSIVSSATSGINEVVSQGLLSALEDVFKGKIKDLGKTGTYLAGGLGFAGSLVSGASKKTSAAGQMAGGALSGAAAGMMFGPYGAAIGAVIGGIGGLFSAKSAQKQEKLQEQQLAEQRKQTAIMERDRLLAYQSIVQGQMTANGMVTSIDRNSRGELVAKISGQDILFVIERAGGKR